MIGSKLVIFSGSNSKGFLNSNTTHFEFNKDKFFEFLVKEKKSKRKLANLDLSEGGKILK